MPSAPESIGLAEEALRIAVRYRRRPEAPRRQEPVYQRSRLAGTGGLAMATTHRADGNLLAAQVDRAAIHLGACCTGFKYAADGVAVQFEDMVAQSGPCSWAPMGCIR